MSYELVAKTWGVDVPPTQKLVLLALAHFADGEGRCFPKVETIVEHTGLSRRAVAGAIKALRDAGHIEVESGKLNGKHSTYLLPYKCG